jgi:TRAP-type mannitol/chloroaromatic compound transport system permease small subunit
MADSAGTGLGLLIAVKVVCCGGLVLLATGALSGLGVWVADRWYVWIGGAIAIAAALMLNNRRHCRVDVQNGTISKCDASVTPARLVAPRNTAFRSLRSTASARAGSEGIK